MSSKEKTAAKAAAPVEAKKRPRDEYHGKGGSYVVGADGKRQLQHRTQRGDEQAESVSTTSQPSNPVTAQENTHADA